MSITFQVSKVKRALSPLTSPDLSSNRLSLLNQEMEAMGASKPFLSSSGHALVHAVGTAFEQHRPLVLSPDMLWLPIAQGFALHLKENAEAFRGRLVRHQGKKNICIRRDDFLKGARDNPWPEVFNSFSDEIAGSVGRLRDLVVCNFSTTGPIEVAASELVLLDALQHYFDYEFLTLCGIPEITLEGTVADWRSIRARTQALQEYDLAWWTSELLPVLDCVVAAAEGRVDVPFWKSLFKTSEESGGPYIQGWINVLFPYILEMSSFRRNPNLSHWRDRIGKPFSGAPIGCIPAGLSSVPFRWEISGLAETIEYPMRMLGGFVGIGQDEGSLAVRPVIGWAVCDEVPVQSSPTDV